MENDLSARGKTIRDQVVAHLEEAGRMHPALEHAITRYARAVELAERCWAAVPKRSIVGRTDRGGQRVHPAIEAALSAERAAAAFGQALGIEPKAAAGRPGRQIGQLVAPDRAARREPPRLSRVK